MASVSKSVTPNQHLSIGAVGPRLATRMEAFLASQPARPTLVALVRKAICEFLTRQGFPPKADEEQG